MAVYKSKFEQRVFEGDLSFVEYEPKKVQYVTTKNYVPDGVLKTKDGEVWFELKGRFRDHTDARRYIDVRENFPEVRFVFVFQSKYTRMPRSKKTYIWQWAEKHGFEYTFESELQDWIRENLPHDLRANKGRVVRNQGCAKRRKRRTRTRRVRDGSRH